MAAIPHDDDDDDDDVSRIGSLNDDKPQRRNSESYCLDNLGSGDNTRARARRSNETVTEHLNGTH